MSTYSRAVACLCALCALVLDDSTERTEAQDNIKEMSASEVMRELATWKSDASMMPEWKKVIQQHGF